MTHAFSQFDLNPLLTQTLADLGYTEPTPIQAALIPVMLTGQDVMGQAQTGTGKTAAFALPTLNKLVPGAGHVQALVLVPTRELAMQVATAMYTYGRALGVRVLPVYGGQPYHKQVDRIKKGVEVVVATPGRLLDLIKQGALDLSGVSTVVLDEADEMLSMGFSEDLEAILDATPSERQTAVLSATLPHGIRRLADKYLRDPQACTVAHQQKTGDAIAQRYYAVRHPDKTAAITRLLEVEPVTSVLIFAQMRASTVELASALAERGFSAEALNGEMSQSARDEVLNRFRQQRIQILVATDVAARGLDIDHVSHVINVDLPRDPEVYVHRIGRTGRAGKTGVAISLVAPFQRALLRKIEGYTKQSIAQATLPTPEAIEKHRDTKVVEQLTMQIQEGPTARDQSLLVALVAAGHDPMDIAAAALSLARTDEKQRPIAPISESHERPDRRESPRPTAFSTRPNARPDRGGVERGIVDRGGSSSPEEGMVPLVLNTGRADGIRPSQVVGALAHYGDIPGNVIGKIRIEEQHTRVDVPAELAEKVLARAGGYRIGKQRITVARA